MDSILFHAMTRAVARFPAPEPPKARVRGIDAFEAADVPAPRARRAAGSVGRLYRWNFGSSARWRLSPTQRR